MSFTFSFEVVSAGEFIALSSGDSAHKAASPLVTNMMNMIPTMAMAQSFAVGAVANEAVGEYKAGLKLLHDMRCAQEAALTQLKLEQEQEKQALLAQEDHEAQLSALQEQHKQAIEALEQKHQKEGNACEAELERLRHKVVAVNRVGVALAAIAAVLASIVLFFAGEEAETLLGQDAAVAEITKQFFRVYGFAMLGLMPRMAFEQMILAHGEVFRAMCRSLSMFVVGTGLSFGLGSLAGFGPAGFAAGSLFESIATACLYGLDLAKGGPFHGLRLFNFSSLPSTLLTQVRQEIHSLILPIATMWFTELLVTFFQPIFAAKIDVKAEAALAPATQFFFFWYIAQAAFGIASQVLFGNIVGAKAHDRASRTGRRAMGVTLAISAVPCAIVLAAPQALRLATGSNDPKVADQADAVSRIMAAGVFVDAARRTMSLELRQLNDQWGATIINSLCMLIAGLGVAAGLGEVVGIEGIVMGFTLGVLSAAVVLAPRWWQRTKPESIEEATQADPQTFCEGVVSVFCCCGSRERNGMRVQDGPVYSPLRGAMDGADGRNMGSPVAGKDEQKRVEEP